MDTSTNQEQIKVNFASEDGKKQDKAGFKQKLSWKKLLLAGLAVFIISDLVFKGTMLGIFIQIFADLLILLGIVNLVYFLIKKYQNKHIRKK